MASWIDSNFSASSDLATNALINSLRNRPVSEQRVPTSIESPPPGQTWNSLIANLKKEIDNLKTFDYLRQHSIPDTVHTLYQYAMQINIWKFYDNFSSTTDARMRAAFYAAFLANKDMIGNSMLQSDKWSRNFLIDTITKIGSYYSNGEHYRGQRANCG